MIKSFTEWMNEKEEVVAPASTYLKLSSEAEEMIKNFQDEKLGDYTINTDLKVIIPSLVELDSEYKFTANIIGAELNKGELIVKLDIPELGEDLGAFYFTSY